jgi:L-seryl-tRNA(Ser) seleniumtransferase
MVPERELAALAHARGLPFVVDLGSGALVDLSHYGLPKEPTPQDALAHGADLVTFSGDKLLGGPQAGIIVGRKELVGRIRRHPLMRALRVDKLTYAALEATLVEYVAGRAAETIPVQRMLATSADHVRMRAESLAARLSTVDGWRVEIVAGKSAVGGGSAPGVEVPTWLVALERLDASADAIEERLRALEPPVIARIENDRVVLDLRTVDPDQDAQLADLIPTIAS